MIAIGQHAVKHIQDIQEIGNRVKAILADWTPPAAGGGIVALADTEEDAMSKIEAHYKAAGLLDQFTKDRPLLASIIKMLLPLLLSGLTGG